MSNVVGFLAAALIVLVAVISMCVHKIDEGHVGVYYRVSKMTNSLPAGLEHLNS